MVHGNMTASMRGDELVFTAKYVGLVCMIHAWMRAMSLFLFILVFLEMRNDSVI